MLERLATRNCMGGGRQKAFSFAKAGRCVAVESVPVGNMNDIRYVPKRSFQWCSPFRQIWSPEGTL
jgi:hypothetical protein